MRALVCIPDGAADEPVPELGGRTPLTLGEMPVLSRLARQGTDVVLTYDFGGYAKGGLAETLAAPVDKVLGEQVARLKKYVETGKPD